MQDETDRNEPTNSLRVSTVSAMVAAYLSNNHVTVDQIPSVIATFTSEVDTLIGGGTVEAAPAEPEKVQPFTTVRKSIQPDYLVSLFDGRRFKSLRRYLMTSHNMTPDDYRAYFDLPKDYPMVAPNYAAKRSELAKKMGLGRGGRGRSAASAETTEDNATKTPAKKTAPRKAPTKADLNKAGVGTGEEAEA